MPVPERTGFLLIGYRDYSTVTRTTPLPLSVRRPTRSCHPPRCRGWRLETFEALLRLESTTRLHSRASDVHHVPHVASFSLLEAGLPTVPVVGWGTLLREVRQPRQQNPQRGKRPAMMRQGGYAPELPQLLPLRATPMEPLRIRRSTIAKVLRSEYLRNGVN